VLGLERLRQELGQAPVHVELDLRKATDQAKRADTRQEGQDHFTTFIDPWLVLEADLRDRSRLRAAMVERTIVRRRTKRSRSGKAKTKSKSKARLMANLTLRRPKRAGNLSGEPPPVAEVMPGVSVKDVGYKERSATIKTVVNGEWSSEGEHGRLNATELFDRLLQVGRQITETPRPASA
jgi:hypothetical protein